MKNTPGFVVELQHELQSLTNNVVNRIDRFGGLDLSDIVTFLTKPIDYTVDNPDNLQKEHVVLRNEVADSYELGQMALDNNEVCIVVYESSINEVSSTRSLPIGMSLLGLKQIQSLGLKNVWYVVPASRYNEVQLCLSAITHDGEIKVFRQYESICLNPDNTLLKKEDSCELYSCGTGDAINCFIENGALSSFVSSGGKYLYFVDIANILASPDATVLGYHIASKSPITYEVVRRNENENAPIACRFLGTNQVVEKFRLSFETEDNFEWTATGSFIVRADLDIEKIKLPWHRMKRNVNGRLTVQYERFLNDLTSLFKTNFIEVERENRYQIVKSEKDFNALTNSFEFK